MSFMENYLAIKLKLELGRNVWVQIEHHKVTIAQHGYFSNNFDVDFSNAKIIALIIFFFLGDPRLLGKLNNMLGNEAILEMSMKTLAPAFKDPKKREWFEEVLDNFLKLWESNL